MTKENSDTDPLPRRYFHYWGKAQSSPEVPAGDKYHFLPYRNLDVAACGYWLVKHNRFQGGVTGHHGNPPGETDDGTLAFHDDDILAAREYLADLSAIFPFTDYPPQFADKDWQERCKIRICYFGFR